MADKNIYVAGGTVQAQKGALYLYRQSDEDLLTLCRKSTFAYVLTARQMGKSSLMVKAAERLAEEKIRSVTIDLTQVGRKLAEEEWYVGILYEIKRQLGLHVNVMKWWQEQDGKGLGTTQRLVLFFEEVLLVEMEHPVVIFIDEIETTRKLDFTDDFFAAIRSLYNLRATKPAFHRLTFVLIGVATPNSLIQDQQLTPFNIGSGVVLTDFTFDEALPLAEGLGMGDADARRVLELALRWTGGHPYLTQRLCRTIAEAQRKEWLEEDLDSLVMRIFRGEGSFQDSNLRFVQEMLLTNEHDRADVLATYRQILRGRRVVDEEQSLVKSHLKLSGVVYSRDNLLHVRNPIYREVFNEQWVKEHFPVNWTKRLTRVAAVLVLTLMALSIPTSIWALIAQRKAVAAQQEAVAERDEARLQRQLADEARAEAIRQRDIAEKNRREAERQATNAQKQTVIAEAARRSAEAATQKEAAARAAAELAARNEAIQRARAERLADVAKEAADKERAAKQEAIAQRDAAEGSRLEADKLREAAFRGQLGASAEVTRNQQAKLLGRSILMARESVARSLQASAPPSTLAYQALSQGLALLPIHVATMLHQNDVDNIFFSPNGKYLATLSRGVKGGDTVFGILRLWDAATSREIKFNKQSEEPISDVNNVIFSKNETYMAVAVGEGSLRVWDLTTGRETFPVKPEHAGATFLEFDPDDEKRLIVATHNNIGMVNVITGDIVTRYLDAPAEPAEATVEITPAEVANSVPNVWQVKISPDGKYLAAVLGSQSVKVWELHGGRAVSELAHKGVKSIEGLTFLQNGNLATITGNFIYQEIPEKSGKHQYIVDYKIWEWRLSDGSLIGNREFDDGPSQLAFSRDGEFVAASGTALSNGVPGLQYDDTARVWKVSTGKRLAFVYPGARVNCIALSGDGKYLATGLTDETTRVWEVATGREVSRLIGGATPERFNREITSVTFSPDGRYIARGGRDDAAVVWKAPGGEHEILRQLEGDSGGLHNKFAFSPDGKYFILSSTLLHHAEVVEIESGHQIVLQDNIPNLISFSADGRYAATAFEDLPIDDTIPIWDVVNGKKVAEVTVRRGIKDIALSRNGKHLATQDAYGTVNVYDVGTKTMRQGFDHGANIGARHMIFSPDGNYLATAGSDYNVRVWEVASGKVLATLLNDRSIGVMAFSPDGEYLATAVDEKPLDENKVSAARIWNWRRQSTVFQIEHQKPITDMTFSRLGTYLTTASLDNTAQIWEVKNRNRIATVRHQDALVDVAFSQDEQYLVTVSTDSTTRVWEVKSGQETARFNSRDGREANFGGEHGQYVIIESGFLETHSETQIWLWNPQDLLKEACSRLTIDDLTEDEWQQYFSPEEFKRYIVNQPRAAKCVGSPRMELNSNR